MQTTRMRWTCLVTLALMVGGAANDAHAQDAPPLRGEDKLTDATLGRARTSPGLQVNTAYPLHPAHDGRLHPRRGQRLLRTGGALLGLGLVFVVGAAIRSYVYEPCDDDDWGGASRSSPRSTH